MLGVTRFRLLAAAGLALLIAGPCISVMLIARPDRVSAVETHRRFVPGISADGAHSGPQLAPPTPAPPFLRLRLDISVRALELGDTATGSLPVFITASVDTPYPGPNGSVYVQNGTFSITDEGRGIACGWDRTLTQPFFIVTISPATNGDVLADIDGPDWFYTIVCPPPAPPLRSPKFGVEGLRYFLLPATLAYRVNEGVRIPTLAEPPGTCVQRRRQIDNTAFNGTVRMVLTIYDPLYPGCTLPLPDVPSAFPPPSPPPPQTPAYDPGGTNFTPGYGPS